MAEHKSAQTARGDQGYFGQAQVQQISRSYQLHYLAYEAPGVDPRYRDFRFTTGRPSTAGNFSPCSAVERALFEDQYRGVLNRERR
ncbi:hypothetical protein GCM10009753_02040 [Streptantibioticus ferralitis]